jgi:RNA polymerase sigma factor (sigma-70 family)
VVGDEAQLYERLATRVERIVRSQVDAPPEVVEDACHHAWAKLINHSERINRETALSWLITTAVRQAWKLERRDRRESSLEAAVEERGELPVPSRLPGPAERAELHERLAELGRLSERQRQMVWLRAVGLSYFEMAAYTGGTVRSVERQLARATARMRDIHEEREGCKQELAPAPLLRGPSSIEPVVRSIDERGLER